MEAVVYRISIADCRFVYLLDPFVAIRHAASFRQVSFHFSCGDKNGGLAVYQLAHLLH